MNKDGIRKAAICGALTVSLLAPMSAANAAPAMTSQNVAKSATSTSSGVASYTIKHTKGGAIINGKLKNVNKPTRVTLRVDDNELKGQTGNFEWEYTDSKGNFSIEIDDLNDTHARYWQLENGGGFYSYYKYSPVMIKGKVANGATSTFPTKPAPTPTKPTPKPTTPPVTGTPNATNGKGGAMTNRQFINYSGAGKNGQYHVYASGINNSKPVGVIFQFHGDGGYEFTHPDYKLKKMAEVAKSKNMILVSMKAPNSQNVWWNDIERNGDYVRSLIQNEVYGKYNIDKNKVWIVGYSGGSEFTSYEMLEEQNDLFTGGGSIMFGGGGSPGSFARQPSAALKANFEPTWYTGLDDNMGNSDPGWSAINDAREGYNFYKKQGFTKAKLVTPAGIDHFEYDEPSVLRDKLNATYK